MKALAITLVLSACFLVGCKDKPTPAPTPRPDIPETMWGCSASRTKGLILKKKTGGYYSGTAATQAEARAIARQMLLDELPGKEPDVNCWDCSREDLDAVAREVCDN